MTLWRRRLPGLLLGTAISLVFLEALRSATGASFSWIGIVTRGLVVLGLFVLSFCGRPYPVGGNAWVWPWPGIAVLLAGVLAWIAYAISASTLVAWIAFTGLGVLVFQVNSLFALERRALRWAGLVVLALAGGVIPVLAVQIEGRFSEEEFFAALQALVFACTWLVLLITWNRIAQNDPEQSGRGVRIPLRGLALIFALVVFVGSAGTVRAYQQSFYPSQAPTYPGISPATPFLCGSGSADAGIYDGTSVFRQLLAEVEQNPLKGTPEYGMLALGTGDTRWAEAFRAGLLHEASQGLFAQPANSVKSIQYDAALRAYYFSSVLEAFPGLFNRDEEQRLRNWFASINRRALTAEWVDWMYGLAFSKWPEGPYENQENGAGLLAVLESTGLQARELSKANEDYLRRGLRGWTARFRNTDDAYIYQPEWIHNAFFQSLVGNQGNPTNVQDAFQWMLLQALPGGSPMGYNHPSSFSVAGISYLGARLLGDDRYIWLSGSALANKPTDDYVFAEPGVEKPVDREGHSPTEGSCLLYGDSGLPNQQGPLAPDKIVFRDGWAADSAYLLVNLRFTGWHRYKATNTVTMFYQGGPLITEELTGNSYLWLPTGRSLIRDKRIPRENLNGLLVPRTGMDAVLYDWVGIGGPWAQDPPYYASVERFETSLEKDVSSTVLENWHGWRHTRTIYFYHGGPTVLFDDAVGPQGQQAEIVWHTPSEAELLGNRIQLRGGQHPAEMVVQPIGSAEFRLEPEDSANAGSRVVYSSPEGGGIRTFTVFLTGNWVGAKVGMVDDGGRRVLEITGGQAQILIPVAADGIAK